MHRRLAGAVALAAVWLAACASGAGRTGGGSVQGSVITADDLRGTTFSTAYEVLTHNHLVDVGSQDVVLSAARGETSLGSAGGGRAMLLVLNGARTSSGVVDVLRSIEVQNIRRIQILRPSEAASRFGTGAQNGVLVIQTKSGG
ncbi:MAG TPA: hypothetical protein VKB18_05250 [Gemmatimonadota bacterium]|nr:hypothetical protein [Gemmatimonadota bacterium]